MKTSLKSVEFPEFITLLIIALVFSSNIQGQKLIARQGGGTPAFHTNLDDAITHANNGDTLYIPGGYFEISVPINKELHFVGEGHNPESSRANGVTYVNGVVSVLSEASGSSFHGLYVTPFFGLEDGANHILVERCNIHGFTQTSASGAFKEYIMCNEVIFREEFGCHLIYSEFNNCFFQRKCYLHWRNCSFKNNIFLFWGFPWDAYYNVPSLVDFSSFENNIFITTEGIRNAVSCTFYNNIFVGEPAFDGTNIIGANNIINQAQESIFENQTEYTFLYGHNYHLKATSPGKNAGTDGKDIGIYGGPSPWKDGSVPFNPHVEFKNIAGHTNPDGRLSIKIHVSAQQY